MTDTDDAQRALAYTALEADAMGELLGADDGE